MRKNQGKTRSEQYLTYLSEKTFLSLWSYPNPSIRKGRKCLELCDLIVVFDEHVILFSDKDIEYPNTADEKTAWARWFKKAVWKSAKQLWGAERHIAELGVDIYIDEKCDENIPVSLPDKMKIHRIAVARGVSTKIKNVFGGSGTLFLNTELKGFDDHITNPFHIGVLDTSKGYIHVFDEDTLDLIMKELDTVSDFIQYIEDKEEFASRKSFFAAGEEELLAFYIYDVNNKGERRFPMEENVDSVSVTEGMWDKYVYSTEYQTRDVANRGSYYWDYLIDKFTELILNNDLEPLFDDVDIRDTEIALRLMAKENRFQRRSLSQSLQEFLVRSAENYRDARAIFRNKNNPTYLFVTLEQSNESWTNYRRERRALLFAYCLALKLRKPKTQTVIGLATEPGLLNEGRSEDLIFYDMTHWTPENDLQAKHAVERFGLLKTQTEVYYNGTEYSDEVTETVKTSPKFSTKIPRNSQCPCGSGKKYKRCCMRK